MAMEPECIVLDEATAMLDPIGRQRGARTVHKLNREQGITVVLITHHMDEAEQADRVIVMNDGLVAMDGTPREVFTRVEELRGPGPGRRRTRWSCSIPAAGRRGRRRWTPDGGGVRRYHCRTFSAAEGK